MSQKNNNMFPAFTAFSANARVALVAISERMTALRGTAVTSKSVAIEGLFGNKGSSLRLNMTAWVGCSDPETPLKSSRAWKA